MAKKHVKADREELEVWSFFHRNADPVAHDNEQRFRYGGIVCPDCKAQRSNAE